MIHTGLKYQGKTPLDYQYTLKKIKGRRIKKGIFLRWISVGWGRHKEKLNEGEYGRYILYSYMKIEE
jgi:hypothetical protein